MTKFASITLPLVAAFVCGLATFGGSVQANGSLTCSFLSGAVKTYENGGFKDEKVESLEFIVEDIDQIRQTATLRTQQGKGELKMVRAIGANHYLEVVTEGFLNMTTIYDALESGGPMPAVHSRHFGFFGAPFVSQFYGTCIQK